MRVDAHMHFTPPEYVAELKRRGLLSFPLPAWSAGQAIGFLDAHGIDLGVLSLSPPGVAFGDQALADHLARLVNEATAAEIAAHAGRFVGLAVLPLPDPDRALEELHDALDRLELDGVVLLSQVLGRYPGDAAWTPLFDELNARGAYVLVHPTAPPYALPLPDQPPWVYEFPFETTRAVAGLIAARAPERWPDIRLQVAHLGGTIPFLGDRLASLGEPAATRAFLRRLYYDTALAAEPAALAAARRYARPDRIVLGSDWPYVEAIDPAAQAFAANGAALLGR
jgi:predicted TIM-barrel fold metal-dependent hydrolase